jgi:hypothetical protein
MSLLFDFKKYSLFYRCGYVGINKTNRLVCWAFNNLLCGRYIECGDNVANPGQVGGHDCVVRGQGCYTGGVVGEYEASEAIDVPATIGVMHERRAWVAVARVRVVVDAYGAIVLVWVSAYARAVANFQHCLL